MNEHIAMRASAFALSLRRLSRSHSRVAKKLSPLAVSEATPTGPRDGLTPASLHLRPKATDVNVHCKIVWAVCVVAFKERFSHLVSDHSACKIVQAT